MNKNNISLNQIIVLGIIVRSLSILFLMFLVYGFVDVVAKVFNIAISETVILLYLAVGFFLIFNQFFTQVLESLLWQKQAQYLNTLARLLGISLIVTMLLMDGIDIQKIIIVELIAESSLMIALLIAYFLKRKSDIDLSLGDCHFISQNKKRIAKYGFWGYLQNISALFYGSAPNRLVASHYLPVAEVAVYGLVDSLTRLARRFQPTNFLIGMIQPIYMAKFTSSGDFSELVRFTDLIYRVNQCLLLFLMGFLILVGDKILLLIVDPAYSQVPIIFSGFLFLLILEGKRRLLSLMAQAVEKNHITVYTNIILSCSLVISIYLFSFFGIWALLIANVTGVVISNYLILHLLSRYGYAVRLSNSKILHMYLVAITSTLMGSVVHEYTESGAFALLFFVTVYFSLLYMKAPFHDNEIDTLKKVSPVKLRWL